VNESFAATAAKTRGAFRRNSYLYSSSYTYPSSEEEKMTEDFDDLYGSNYLAAADLKRPLTTVIEQVEHEDFARQGEKKKMKAVLFVRGIKKPIVVNKTNALKLATAFGKDFDAWIDQRIIIKAEDTTFGGRPTKGLRLYPANSEDEPAPKALKPRSKQSNSDLNDELPEDL
jgi:hypothetical protein